MERRTKPPNTKLSQQLEHKHQNSKNSNPVEYDGHNLTVSTGSTLLDLAISGGRFRDGGIPSGILVEIFGPSGAGKTVLLSQIAGNVQRLNGNIMFHDPEARLNKQFARMFGLDTDEITYTTPNTVTEVFQSVRAWAEKQDSKTIKGVFADSLAALSTDLEMEKDEGDKMGMRRAKEFSEELRKTCRIITRENILMICSNQVRQNLDAGPYGQRFISPGGQAIGFYSSLRLRCSAASKIKAKKSVHGKEHERIIGVKTEVEVYKSSVWKPFHTAEVFVLFDYGIDDIRGNLAFVKSATSDTLYRIGEKRLGKSLEHAIHMVEDEGLEQELKNKVIDVWNEIETKFTEPRKPKEW